MKKLIASLLVLAASATAAQADTVFCRIDTPAGVASVSAEFNQGELVILAIDNPSVPRLFKGAKVEVVNDYLVKVGGHDMGCVAPIPHNGEEDQADYTTGSEFEMRGDIARPEYKGANTFEGEALYNGEESMGKVTLVRFANGDIKVIAGGKERGVFKRDADIASIPNTYSEPRSETTFVISATEFYSVVNTKLVK
ncbi:hypothetical protein ACVOZ6_003454 [Escherichia coli]